MILFVVGSLIWRVGILDCPVSDADDVISLLMSHMLDSSTPSIHCAQCSALVLCSSSEYQLRCCRYSSCIGCCPLRRWYFDLPPSCCVFFFSVISSLVHHLFMYGLGFMSLTCFVIASCMASFSVLSLPLNVLASAISVGIGRLARLDLRVFPNSVQSVRRKLHLGSHAVFSVCMSICVTIG
jgi:hypothetical protein